MIHFALPLLLLAGTPPGTTPTVPPPPTDLESRLRSHPDLVPVLDDAEALRLQIVVGFVEPNEKGENVLRQETFRAGAEYFYPASSVKLFAAVAAAQKIAALRESTGLDIDLDTPMVFHPLFEDDVLEREDPDNVDGGVITVRQEIREIFLVSSNEAFNYLYEFVGQDGIAESLRKAGLESPRIVHRLSEFRTEEENRMLPQVDLVGEGFSHSIAARTTAPLPAAPAMGGLEVGKAYY
ncbi:MAG: class A beta-lactamase-related serine hydrolase, partial [Thermoanaerobaculia bacterium]|nr:class A beta-lactamase-related serine hydrolase [Thermoanaerobaculia bacterium]